MRKTLLTPFLVLLLFPMLSSVLCYSENVDSHSPFNPLVISQSGDAGKSERPVNSNQVLEMLNEVSSSSLYSVIYDMQNFTTRFYQTPNLNSSADYIVSQLDNYANLSIECDYFDYNGYIVRNIVATLPGLDTSNHTIYIIGAHYDSKNKNYDPSAPASGADDDATGVAATLETARIFNEHRFTATVKFAFWTVEEAGLIEARAMPRMRRAMGWTLVQT